MCMIVKMFTTYNRQGFINDGFVYTINIGNENVQKWNVEITVVTNKMRFPITLLVQKPHTYENVYAFLIGTHLPNKHCVICSSSENQNLTRILFIWNWSGFIWFFSFISPRYYICLNPLCNKLMYLPNMCNSFESGIADVLLSTQQTSLHTFYQNKSSICMQTRVNCEYNIISESLFNSLYTRFSPIHCLPILYSFIMYRKVHDFFKTQINYIFILFE